MNLSRSFVSEQLIQMLIYHINISIYIIIGYMNTNWKMICRMDLPDSAADSGYSCTPTTSSSSLKGQKAKGYTQNLRPP